VRVLKAGKYILLIFGFVSSCKDCITAFLSNLADKGEDGRCPTCSHTPVQVIFFLLISVIMFLMLYLQESDLLEVMLMKHDDSDNKAGPSSTVMLRRNDFRSSTKLDALIQSLRKCCFVTLSINFN
jgi:DNA repair protein RAD5